jgi:(2Fe-2S) ferredoxin
MVAGPVTIRSPTHAMMSELPQVFTRHLFMCATERPPGHPRGSCGAQGAKGLWEYLSIALDKLGKPEIGRTASGCFGFCSAGPILVIYPEGVWYLPRTREDIDAIIATHLVGGELVERLAVVPRV